MTESENDFNLVERIMANKNHLGKSDFENLWSAILKQRDENLERQRLLEQERAEMLNYFSQREQDVSNQIEKIRRGYADREANLENRVQKQQEEMDAKEKANRERLEGMNAEVHVRLAEISHQKEKLEKDIKAFKDEKSRYDQESKEKLQTISAEFVGDVVLDLKTRQKRLLDTSSNWSLAGGGALVFGLLFSAFSFYQTSSALIIELSWPALTFQTIKGAIFLGLAGVLSRYAFLLSRRYLDESLRVSDIVHDVSFGQLYIQSYGASAGWDQVKEAFSRWHRANGSGIEGQERLQKENSITSESTFEISQINKLLETIKDFRK